MAFDAITQAEVDRNSPLTPELLTKMRNRAHWNWTEATPPAPFDAEAAARALILLMRTNNTDGHRHQGTAKDAPKIDTAGIVPGSVDSANMQDSIFVPADFGAGKWIDGDHLYTGPNTPDIPKASKWAAPLVVGGSTGANLTVTVPHGLGRSKMLLPLLTLGANKLYVSSVTNTGCVLSRWSPLLLNDHAYQVQFR